MTENLWGANPVFKMAVTNLEEAVPKELVSLPGAPVSAVNADFVKGDMNIYGIVYMNTVGRGTTLW